MADTERASRRSRSWSGFTTGIDASLVAAGTASLVMKVIAAGAALLTNVVLARLLHVDEYGRYAVALSWLNVLAIGSLLGWDRVVLREIPVLRQRGDWGAIRGLLTASTRHVVGAGIVVGLVFLASYRVVTSGLTMLAVIAAAALPLPALRSVYQSAVQGLGRVTMAQVPDLILRPFAFLVLLTCAGILMKGHVTAGMALVLYAATLMLVVVVTRSLIGPIQAGDVAAIPADSSWHRHSFQLFVYGALTTLNSHVDVLVVGGMSGPKAAAVFNVAANCATIISLPLFAFNAALAPKVARLYAESNLSAIQREVSRTTMMATALAAPVTAAFLFAGLPILRLFGPNYPAGDRTLAILSIGQFINVATGSVGLLLVMTGYELVAARFLGGVLVVKCVAMIAGVRLMGIEGAAAASACAVVAWNLLLHNVVLKKLNIRARLSIPRE